MAPSKATPDGRRKSANGKPSMIITLTVSPSSLQKCIGAAESQEDTPIKDEATGSPAESTTAAPPVANGETASDSNAATPAKEGTPMGPPTDNPKKKGVKRSAPKDNDGIPKPRGKPGPKKKPRLEDGTIDPNATKGAVHKLGPKANQGAINAGLRALDRSGKPCRKWNRGGFTLKSFTGVVWEVPRWTAPPKALEEGSTEASAAASADNSSSKENKENGIEPNSVSNSNAGGDIEVRSVPSITASSPAPVPFVGA